MKPWKIYLVFQGIVTGLEILLPTGKKKRALREDYNSFLQHSCQKTISQASTLNVSCYKRVGIINNNIAKCNFLVQMMVLCVESM